MLSIRGANILRQANAMHSNFSMALADKWAKFLDFLKRS